MSRRPLGSSIDLHLVPLGVYDSGAHTRVFFVEGGSSFHASRFVLFGNRGSNRDAELRACVLRCGCGSLLLQRLRAQGRLGCWSFLKKHMVPAML